MFILIIYDQFSRHQIIFDQAKIGGWRWPNRYISWGAHRNNQCTISNARRGILQG